MGDRMASTSTPGSAGIGQQTPLDSVSDFYVISFMISQALAELDTIKLGKVTAVHPGSGDPPAVGTVDVQLLVGLVDGAGNVTEQGIVYGLPYFRLQGGPWAIVCDPAVGDVGVIACSDRDITAVKSTANQAPPGSRRKYNISDGIYFGTVLSRVPKAWAWLKNDGTFNITDQFGNVIESSSAGMIMNFPSGGGLTVNGYVRSTAEVTRGFGTSSSVTLGGHIHSQAPDSHGDTEEPTSAPEAGT